MFRNKTKMTVTTNDRGQMNMFAKEPQMYYENYGMYSPSEIKERTNGRWLWPVLLLGLFLILSLATSSSESSDD